MRDKGKIRMTYLEGLLGWQNAVWGRVTEGYWDYWELQGIGVSEIPDCLRPERTRHFWICLCINFCMLSQICVQKCQLFKTAFYSLYRLPFWKRNSENFFTHLMHNTVAMQCKEPTLEIEPSLPFNFRDNKRCTTSYHLKRYVHQIFDGIWKVLLRNYIFLWFFKVPFNTEQKEHRSWESISINKSVIICFRSEHV